MALHIKWHKSGSETVLIDRFSSKIALLRNRDRESKWTQRIAAGSKRFIEQMKGSLGFRAKGRKIIGADDTFELRQMLRPLTIFMATATRLGR